MRYSGLKRVAVIGLSAVMLCGCGVRAGEGEQEQAEMVTIRLFTNLPDRKSGQGYVEQLIIDEYMEENPNIQIQVEALDDEAFKTKIRAYSLEGMPDIVNIWGQPSFLDELVGAGLLQQLDIADYAEYQFMEDSLNGFLYDEQLYGLPRNSDVQCIYYNRALFEAHGWQIPDTYEELLSLAGRIRTDGYIPMAIDGIDGWPLAVFLSDVLYKLTGEEYAEVVEKAIREQDFTDPRIEQAALLLQRAAKAGLFQDGYESQDYGTAMNLFANGSAAMYYMGSWEVSMAQNEEIPEEIRNAICVFTMPVIEGGAASETEIAAWHGGGYAVAADSEVKEEAVRFLNYMFQPDKLSKYGWETGVCMTAQNQSAYMTGKESALQMQILSLLNGATGVSGTPINDCGPSAFKHEIESEIQSMTSGNMSVEEFLERIGEACR